MKNSTKDIPKIKSFRPIAFPEYSRIELSNGAPVYILPSLDYDVLKVEVNYRAGRVFETTHKGVARACANQMKEGAGTYSSEDIAQTAEFYGATLQTSGGMDFSRLELYAQCKHLGNLLPLATSILHEPHFPQKELDNYIKRNRKKLAIDLAKNDIVAYRILTEMLFGKDHPYGYNSDPETIGSLNRQSVLDHFTNNYTNAYFSVIVAGGVEDNTIKLLDDHFGQLGFAPESAAPFHRVQPSEEKQFESPGMQKFQSSVRLGRKLFGRSNPDYPALYVLNTILGGYFGSRLMSNIREDKGLTYDIFSSLDMLWLDGYLLIGAEVDNENVSTTLDEIYSEFEKLQTKPVSDSELELVKNYINGNLLNLMNGPFNSIELMRLIAIYGQNLDFFNYFMEEIHRIDAKKIQQIAQKYLLKEDFTLVIVGK